MQRQTKHKSLLNMFQVVLLLNHPHPKTKRTLQRFYIEGCCHSNPWIHTHTLFQFVLKKYCPCNFKTNLRDAVTATHKCTHTHTPCFNLFSTNAVTATLKQIWGMLSKQPINAHTHTHPVSICFQQIKCCYGNFKTNLRDAVTATHKCTHTHTQTLRGDSHLTPSYNTQATLLSQHICNANSRMKVNFKENKFCANSHLIPSFPTEHE